MNHTPNAANTPVLIATRDGFLEITPEPGTMVGGSHIRMQLKAMASGYYDLQKMRIQAGNRVLAQFKARLGQNPGMSEEELDEESQGILAQMRENFDLMMDGVKRIPTPKTFKGNDVISSYAEFALFRQYLLNEEAENEAFKMLAKAVEEFPIWQQYLVNVKGIGTAMAAVLISEIDIEKAEYPSSLHRYAGLDIGPDGKGRNRTAEHLIQRKYANKDGVEAERASITYNPFLRTKLMGVAAGCILKAGKGTELREVYDNYKHRIENTPKHATKTKGHRNFMALRYMIKHFLSQYYNVARALECLPIAPSYAEAKLGIVHLKAAGKQEFLDRQREVGRGTKYPD